MPAWALLPAVQPDRIAMPEAGLELTRGTSQSQPAGFAWRSATRRETARVPATPDVSREFDSSQRPRCPQPAGRTMSQAEGAQFPCGPLVSLDFFRAYCDVDT